MMVAAGCIAYPKSALLLCLKFFSKNLPFMAFFHLLLILSGDIELNPGPKTRYSKK